MEFSSNQKNIFYQKIGEKIKEKRTQRNWTQDQLSKVSRIPRTTLINIERGQTIALHTFISLCSAFKCDYSDLLPDLADVEKIGTLKIRSQDLPQRAAAEIEKILGNHNE